MTRRYLFAGPSLPDAARVAPPGVTVLPPVGGGDLFSLPLEQGDTVGIVDGFFHQRHSVRHKEILAILADGVRVLGAASMGALRAAELDVFGMVGIGTVYEDYRDGRLIADDEVALAHAGPEDSYRPMTEPLVNIRATLDAAEAAGVLDTRSRQRLIGVLARLPYLERTYPRMRKAAQEIGMTAAAAEALHAFCRTHPVDRKREDALLLTQALTEDHPPAPEFELSRTTFLESWRLRFSVTDTGDGAGQVGDLEMLRLLQLYAEDYPRWYRGYALGRIAAECAAECGSPPPDNDPADLAVAHGLHRGLYAAPGHGDFGFLDSWLTAAERTRPLKDRLAIFLARSYRVPPGLMDAAGPLAHLRGTPAAAAARAVARASAEVNERIRHQRPDFNVAELAEERIAGWLAARWKCPEADLELHALDRGFDSVTALTAVARQSYLTVRYNPELAAFRIGATAQTDAAPVP